MIAVLFFRRYPAIRVVLPRLIGVVLPRIYQPPTRTGYQPPVPIRTVYAYATAVHVWLLVLPTGLESVVYMLWCQGYATVWTDSDDFQFSIYGDAVCWYAACDDISAFTASPCLEACCRVTVMDFLMSTVVWTVTVCSSTLFRYLIMMIFHDLEICRISRFSMGNSCSCRGVMQ